MESLLNIDHNTLITLLTRCGWLLFGDLINQSRFLLGPTKVSECVLRDELNSILLFISVNHRGLGIINIRAERTFNCPEASTLGFVSSLFRCLLRTSS